ncbi:hypothetical protein E2C01_055247 [Portunus trituberculatus]|uniref:Uncharacterized protein n=1 Tax=Portunus trituberculatus TaxID=210409 RepID=A0A5B7GQN9_PORTR|nr:hypothetical protein [Portunus trituberculatus]
MSPLRLSAAPSCLKRTPSASPTRQTVRGAVVSGGCPRPAPNVLKILASGGDLHVAARGAAAFPSSRRPSPSPWHALRRRHSICCLPASAVTQEPRRCYVGGRLLADRGKGVWWRGGWAWEGAAWARREERRHGPVDQWTSVTAGVNPFSSGFPAQLHFIKAISGRPPSSL